MSEEITTEEWLNGELAAVNDKWVEVQAAKVQYLASFEIAKARLQKAKLELQSLIANL